MSILAAIAMATASASAPVADAAPAARTTPIASSARASVRVTRAERIDFQQTERRSTERVQVKRRTDGSVRIDFR